MILQRCERLTLQFFRARNSPLSGVVDTMTFDQVSRRFFSISENETRYGGSDSHVNRENACRCDRAGTRQRCWSRRSKPHCADTAAGVIGTPVTRGQPDLTLPRLQGT
jgi:hypothetical protein